MKLSPTENKNKTKQAKKQKKHHSTDFALWLVSLE